MNIKILIVEDDVVFCIMLNRFLSKNNFATDDAQSAEEAIELLQNKSYDVVITDYRLPGKNGLELLEWIKNSAPATKVLIVSRVDEKEISDRAFELGAEDYMTKPINPGDLLNKLKLIHV